MTSSQLSAITTPTVQQFILENEHIDEHKLLLQGKSIYDIPTSIIADQIVGRRKAKTKLPSWFNTPATVYPPGLNLEQSSSEITAQFKAQLINGHEALDLTGGFGVDTFFFAKRFEKFDYVEQNEKLLAVARHNHHKLGVGNIKYHLSTAESFLEVDNAHYDFVYIDPSRRITGDKKVFKLSECEPNIVALQSKIFCIANTIMIKSAPLLDIQLGVKELVNVKTVYVISVDNECKEIVFVCEKDFAGEVQIETVNLTVRGNQLYSFNFAQEQRASVNFSEPLKFVYEPNASILKAGAFKTVAEEFNIKKIHPNTHLYTSDDLVGRFPGKIFEVEALVKADPKAVKELLPDGKANITTRNYPLSPEALKNKLKIQDGGDKFLMGFSGVDKKYLAVAKRIWL